MLLTSEKNEDLNELLTEIIKFSDAIMMSTDLTESIANVKNLAEISSRLKAVFQNEISLQKNSGVQVRPAKTILKRQ